MTIRHRILTAGAVVVVLATAAAAPAFAQPLLDRAPSADTVDPGGAAAQAAENTAAAAQDAVEAEQIAGLATLDATLASVLGNAASDYSIAAYDTATGLAYQYGSTSGMYTASVVKVEILAALLLQHQDAGTTITAQQRSLAALMIEQSDNDAASTLWTAIGGETGLNAASARLGLVSTFGGSNGYWGLTTTSAADQVTLLADLTSSTSALKADSQATLLSLMGSVVGGQDWGVSAGADAGTTTALKNGWLSLSADDGRWLVNTIGLPTVDGSTIQVAVLLRGLSDYGAGVTLAEHISAVVAGGLAGLRDLGGVDQSALSAA